MTTKNKKLLDKAKKLSGVRNDDDVINQALKLFVDNYNVKSRRKKSAYELSKHLAGSIEGPADLGSNKKYLEGFGVE
jgi:hypothetical protein